jgi:hypothetical protein
MENSRLDCRRIVVLRSDQRDGNEIASDGANSASSEARRITAELRVLQSKIVDAWQERAVILTREEQQELKAEIARTCSLLTHLTSTV